ncbi:MAG TPA: phage baseplate assembly protein V [Pyrinomonadaceae bacterium]|nr:phage baseplate assembly protein V [Pyrinomonadaceae bacterium]
MPEGLVESVSSGEERATAGFAIAPGVVRNNLDVLAEGRVQVEIPSLPSYEVWARVSSVGAGSSRGFCWIPQIDDEVLVAFNQNDERDAYILGGLWNTRDRPPMTIPTDFLIKRVIKTGIAGGLGHEIEFDDALQSIKITSSTQQKITIDPLKIEMTNLAGTVTVTLDNTQQAITLQAVASIELKAAQIKLQAVNIDIEGTAATNIKSTGICNINGSLVKIN